MIIIIIIINSTGPGADVDTELSKQRFLRKTKHLLLWPKSVEFEDVHSTIHVFLNEWLVHFDWT